MRFKLFEEYIQDENSEEIDRIASELQRYVNDGGDAYEITEYYYNTIDNIDENGGDVYRLVFLNNEDDLDSSNLGESWTIDKNHLERYAMNLHRNYVIDAPDDKTKEERMNMTPYLITATLDPYSIDFEKSIDIFTYMYYYEYEVILNTNPDDISISEYERTWDDDDIKE